MSKPINSQTDKSSSNIQQWLTEQAAENAAGSAGGPDDEGNTKNPGSVKGAKGGKAAKGMSGVHSNGQTKGATSSGISKGPSGPAAPSDGIDKAGTKKIQSLSQGDTPKQLGNEANLGTTKSTSKGAHFDEVGGLADHATGHSNKTQVESATAQLSSDISTGASDQKISKSLNGLNDAMQAAGQGSQVPSAIKTVLDGSSMSADAQQHVVGLAKANGIDMGTTKNENPTPEQSLSGALLGSPAATNDIKTKTTNYIESERSKGTTDADIGQKLDSLLSASGVSSDASAAALVAAVKNGIDPSNSGADKVAAAKVKIKEKQAQKDAARQAHQESINQGASDSGGGGTGLDNGGVDDGSTSADVAAAKNYSPKDAMSMDKLKSKVPARLAAQFPLIEKTAKKYNLQPQLLVAIAMQESTGGTNPDAYKNGGGMFQFTDEHAWKTYGSGGPDNRANDAAGVVACAKYMSTLINEQGSLGAALRAYNGPVSQGGVASYQTDIYAKMSGTFD